MDLAALLRGRGPLSGLDGWCAFQSGTAALAAALQFAHRDRPTRGFVILPAYSCPSLVAAARHAGLDISFADLASGRLSPGLSEYEAELRHRATGLVVVDLFGIAAPIEALAELARTHGAVAVHDLAQALAGPGLPKDSPADLLVVSLGRGKPATLLGGGATWARDFPAFDAFVASRYTERLWRRSTTLAKGAGYNLALSPQVYGGIARLPFLRLGEARLVPLERVERLPPEWLAAAAGQLGAAARGREQRIARSVALVAMAARAGLEVPPDATEAAHNMGMNRLPVMCASAAQARHLVAAGRSLGVSAMYGRTLPEFAGASAEEAARLYPAAFQTSRRIVTLPTHARMSAADLARLGELLSHDH